MLLLDIRVLAIAYDEGHMMSLWPGVNCKVPRPRVYIRNLIMGSITMTKMLPSPMNDSCMRMSNMVASFAVGEGTPFLIICDVTTYGLF